MLQNLMDFNPLDLLAAAALGQKDGSSDVDTVREDGSSVLSTLPTETKNAEEDPKEDMGKTTKINLKSPVLVKDTSETIMPPQKTPWSPDSFLATTHEDKLELKSDRLSNILEIMNNLENAKYGKKHLSSESVFSDSNTCSNNNNDVCVKNSVNLDKAHLSAVKCESSIGDESVSEFIETEISEDKPAGTPASDSTEQASDTDTAESSDTVKTIDPEDKPLSPLDFIGMDHSYASVLGQPELSSNTEFDEEDDVDICSQSSPLTEETEHRSRNLSLDCNYLKSGILEGVSASTLDLYKISSFGRGRVPSSSSSTSSPTHEMSSKTGKEEDIDSTHCTNQSTTDMASPDKCPKFGKFRIGTFASFSSNNMELEKYLRGKDSSPNSSKKLNIGIPSDMSLISSSLSSPTATLSLHPMLQSPSQDWDRSEADSEVHDDSSESRTPHRLSPDFTSEKVTEWSHPLFHDHDYCLKEGEVKPTPEDVSKVNLAKRKYTKRKSKLDLVSHEKIMKAKYLKKELLKQETPKRVTPELDLSSIESSVMKTNPVGRPKKRPLEKQVEEEIDPETGAKMKITGKFQDQYVYYLSKSSRTTSRRRQTPMPFPPDKIIVPAPKPGDIVVPHLTDADIETVRLKGRAALNLTERPQLSNSIGRLHQSGPMPPNPSNDYDVDSHIVSTILSMENDNLSSAPSPAHSDIASASGLNPHQPALTESLRLMSGDNSITSEHVLNYLLSVVKEDDVPTDNLLGEPGLDTSSCGLFQPLPSDSVYSKVDHLDGPDMSSQSSGQKDITKTSSNFNSLTSSIHPVQDFVSSVHKEDTGRLPDDFSSFMSSSQGTSTSSSSNTSQSMFGSDLSSLGTPQLSSSFPRLTSIEKTLDYLGVKDGDIKLDQSDLFTSKLHSDTPDSSSLLTPESTLSTEDDTPWIVTVTLYFNDVPAIMVNNQPYIRLVDIHKQILPAKDTGILKKRCQLLKIPVLNCSEMQRYFLVQYGRAYNSKSTLIISKDQATDLVTYYATPQPRMGKGDELPQKGSSNSDSGNGLLNSGVASKKKTSKNGRKSLLPNGLMVPESSEDLGAASSQVPGKRTRHKKINYLEMLRGEESKKSPEDAILETIECVAKGESYFDDHQKEKSSKTKSQSSSKLPSKKKFKKNVLPDQKKKKAKKDKLKMLARHHDKGPKVSKEKLENTAQKLKGSKIHTQEKLTDRQSVLIAYSEDGLDLSQNKSKCQPLKLKVHSLLNFSNQRKTPSASPTKNKKGLFSRSNSSQSSSERPLRVLAVAHQAALAGDQTECHLPSQPADIHLDLFTKSSSPCVRCQTCSQFLSVPHFMRHHHVPMDSEWLASEAAHRILVPRNKENISEVEKKLWEEFHSLQEAIGGFGEADDDSDSEVDSGDEFEVDEDQSVLSLSGGSSILNSSRNSSLKKSDIEGHVSRAEHNSYSSEEEVESNSHTTSSVVQAPHSLTQKLVDLHTQKVKNDMASKIGLVRRNPAGSEMGVLPRKEDTQNSSLRTSSRKRKSKQFFSIENYYTSKKSMNEEDTDQFQDDDFGTVESEVVCSPTKGERLSV